MQKVQFLQLQVMQNNLKLSLSLFSVGDAVSYFTYPDACVELAFLGVV